MENNIGDLLFSKLLYFWGDEEKNKRCYNYEEINGINI